MVANDFNPSTLEADAGRSLIGRPAWSTDSTSPGQPGYTVRPCLERKEKRKEKNERNWNIKNVDMSFLGLLYSLYHSYEHQGSLLGRGWVLNPFLGKLP